MKKLLTILILGFMLIGASAFAYQSYYGQGFGSRGMMQENYLAQGDDYERGSFHEQMEEVLENGTYGDLVLLRKELGINLMPMIVDEETFSLMQERHEEMESYFESQGIEPSQRGLRDGTGLGQENRQGSGKGRGQGQGGFGGCHMFD